MGDGSRDATLNEQIRQNMSMSGQMYEQAFNARKAGTDYAMGTYKMGGFDQGAKYASLRSGILDAAARRGPGDFLHPNAMGDAAAGKAEAISSVGAQQLTAGMDEMNKIRATLAGNGLATTNFAQQEGSTAIAATAQTDPNARMSNINAAFGLASTVYGGFKNTGTTPPPSSQPQQFGLGNTSLSNWATQPITTLGTPSPAGGFGLGLT